MDLLMTDLELIARMGTDAQVWADEFCRVHRIAPGEIVMPAADLKATVLTWFANAIEAGRDAAAHIIADALVEGISPIDPEGVSGELVDGLTALASAHGGYLTVACVALAMSDIEHV
jgi:hypothetical protein